MPANTFVWYELMTTDMGGAESFYRGVMGWDAQPWGSGNPPYAIMSSDQRPSAGIMGIADDVGQAGGHPRWFGYIAVDDVDAETAAVKQAGGAVHRSPTDIPEIGRFSVVADPQGAVFMLFKPLSTGTPPAPAGTPGGVGWHELYTTDWQGAFDFYAERFGWTKAEAMDMGPMGTYQLFAVGGTPIGGMMNKPAELPAPAWTFYFNVASIDAAVARVREAGGKVLMGPVQVPGGSWIIQCTDPQGALFALVAPAR